jgi:uncharacterized protein (DUF1501 family)
MLDRRTLLTRALAAACSAAAHPLITPMAFAAAPGENRLVVIVLRGAMDGLDVVRPTGDRAWAALRPGAGAGEGTLDLGGGFALHPALGGLAPLWQAGDLAFVHAVSTPYRDRRSHFDGQDILEAGTPGVPGAVRDGWLNRLVAALPGGGAQAETAWAIGGANMLILRGAAPVSSWSPEARLDLSGQARLLLPLLYEGDPLFGPAAAQALALAGMEAGDAGGGGAEGPGRALARFAAERLRGAARIAAFSLSGWDTHRGQAQMLPRALGALQGAVLELQAALGPVWERTAVLAVTEFGRTARDNGTGGTDHGTGGAMLLAGGAVRGGRVVADWPGLGEGDLLDDRDLRPTADVRGHVAHVLAALFGVPMTRLAGGVFPALDPGADARLLR